MEIYGDNEYPKDSKSQDGPDTDDQAAEKITTDKVPLIISDEFDIEIMTDESAMPMALDLGLLPSKLKCKKMIATPDG